MSVTTEDVAETIKQKWGLAPAPLNAITLIMGRVPDKQAAPYTSFSVKDNPTQRIATGGYLQSFIVEFRTWVESGAANTGAIKRAIETLFGIQTRTVFNLPNGRQLALMHSVKSPGGLDEDPATQNNQAVKVSTDRFEFLCQG